MKAITIKQPWASLICWGLKDIENRTWKTKQRGRVFIHAGAQWYPGFMSKIGSRVSGFFTDGQWDTFTNSHRSRLIFDGDGLPLSAIIGEVEILDCVENHPSVWAIDGQYHWVLANAIQYETPITCKGALSFWTPDAETLKLCEEMRVKL